MTEWDIPRKNFLQDRAISNKERSALRALQDQLSDGEKAILTRMVKTARNTPPEDNGDFIMMVASDSMANLKDPRLSMGDRFEEALIDIDQAKESEKIYRKLLQKLDKLGVLGPENYEKPHIYDEQVQKATHTYVRLTQQEITKISHVLGMQPPLVTDPSRN